MTVVLNTFGALFGEQVDTDYDGAADHIILMKGSRLTLPKLTHKWLVSFKYIFSVSVRNIY